MPSGGSTQRLLVGIGAVTGVVALVLGTVAWWVAGSSPSASAATAPVAVADPLPSTTSSSTTSSSTTTSTTVKPTTTTSTTVKPRPVTTRPPATSPPPTTPQVTTPPPVAQATNSSPEERCASAHQWVMSQGLSLPAGWGFRCPGTAVVSGAERWGVACWNCAGDGSSWIAVDIGRIGASTAALRYVIAHETCHSIDYTTLGITTEIGADLCAALHGAPRP